MKIYIVTSGEYSDYHINAVFSTKEEAEKYCALNNKAGDNWTDCEIEEWDTQDYKIEGEVPVYYLYRFAIKEKSLAAIDKCKYMQCLCVSERSNSFIEFLNKWGQDGVRFSIYLNKPDMEKARKIAKELLAKHLHTF